LALRRIVFTYACTTRELMQACSDAMASRCAAYRGLAFIASLELVDEAVGVA